MSATKLSITAAHREFGKARNTIAKDIREGTLSAEIGADGSKLIDLSELIRVYGEPKTKRGATATQTEGLPRAATNDLGAALAQLESLHDQLKAERDRERRQLESQIENLQKTLEAAQEGQLRATKLLEHSSAGGEWKQLMEKLIESQSPAQRVNTEQVAEITEAAKRNAFRELQSQSFWRLAWRLMVARAQ